ncbi:DNA-binding response regulator [Tenacibaculum sp. Bg11-29]|uniref:response regulator transcription factor n=1 Tax=Tenacibaculum sp. Bg11-29 TaxID=2058306 RepID=UPI000C347513|nr:response regulator transcription factor [Tenacibaculum sp. Bg11-29]PKH51672.1 DNA-binding response regulator [Tenacibaculum sp. Bg11-29]
MKKILIIEDDIDISKLIEFNLVDNHYNVTTCLDGKRGLELALKEDFSLIILDLTLPNLNGIEVCKNIRRQKQTPIIMLTARSNEIDKILGLELGADDYMTKPFSVRELLSRVSAVIRRNTIRKNQQTKDVYNRILFEELFIDIEQRKVIINSEKINLSPKEFELLVLMASTPGKVYSRDSLLEIIWGYEFEGYRHTVNSHINRLRNKIEKNTDEPKFILTTWGVGYKFNEELKYLTSESLQNNFK